MKVPLPLEMFKGTIQPVEGADAAYFTLAS